MMKKLLIVFIILGLVGAFVGYKMFNKPLENIRSIPADYTLTPAHLLNEFENDENTANALYLDKVIEVSGRVEKVSNEGDKMTLYIDAQNEISNVIFQLADLDPSIKVNDELTLKGICTGYLMDVVLVRAVKI